MRLPGSRENTRWRPFCFTRKLFDLRVMSHWRSCVDMAYGVGGSEQLVGGPLPLCLLELYCSRDSHESHVA